MAFTSLNAIVGGGIFGLPAIVAALLGPAAVLAYGVCAVLVALVGLCFAEAGSRVSRPGGLYAYAGAAFGPVVGGIAGMLLLVANTVAAAAALARFLMDALAAVWPVLGGALIQTLLLGAIYLSLAVLNMRSVRLAARFSTVVGMIKLAPLVLLIAAGCLAIHPANLRWTTLPSVTALGHAVVVLFFAFMGVENGLATSGEAIAPARTIPRAVLLALALVAALYIGLQLTAQGVLGSDLPAARAPLIATATRVFGAWGTGLLLATTILSAAGFLVADILSSPRYTYAMADAGQLPRWFATVSRRHGTPVVAIGVYAFTCFLLAATGSFLQLVVLSSSGTLLLYLICSLGVLRLRAGNVATCGPPFRAPGGAAVPIAAGAIIIWLLTTLSARELGAIALLSAAAGAIYAVRERRRLPTQRQAASPRRPWS